MPSPVPAQALRYARLSARQSRLLTTTALALAAVAVLSAGGTGEARAASGGGQDLGSLGGGLSEAYGVSADGTVVVGNSDDATNTRAFSWTSGAGMVDLGTLGGSNAWANGVSGDGSTIVGRADTAGGDQHAFIWTAGGGIVDLNTLGGANSEAWAVSTDGSVVVGSAGDGTFTRAFRWTAGGGMADLGTLAGGNEALARAVSGDGAVVAGYAEVTGGDRHAFQWTAGGGMSDLNTLGGTDSFAYGISTNGSVIVGESNVAGGDSHAFRWTAGGGMVDLGTLGTGTQSAAYATNRDGSVVVGYSDNGTLNRAFRWTSATGLLTVEDWLRSTGVTVATDITAGARGVSADGNIVVGQLQSGTAFIARANSGIIDLNQYSQTLAGNPTVQIGLDYAGTVLNGAHGQPMRNLLDVGRRSFSVTADTGYDNSNFGEGGVGIGDLAYAIGLEGGMTARFAFGGLYTRQDLDSGGNFEQSGFYVAPELSLPVAGNVYATVGGYYAPGKLEINRGYENGGLNDTSRGKTDIDTWAAKLRLDWLNAASIEDTKLTPYASLTYANAHMDGYTEAGGSFPSQFNAMDDHSTVARIGLDTVTAMTDHVRLLGKAEAAYRFETETANVSGQIVGLSSFNLAGRSIDRFWLRGAIGVEFDMAGGTASLSLNASTEGDDPNVWLKSGWKVTF